MGRLLPRSAPRSVPRRPAGRPRDMPGLAVLLSVVLALLVSPALADGFPAAKDRFLSAFRPEKTAKDRLDAIGEVTAFETKEAAKLLVSGIKRTDAITAPLLEKAAEVRDRISKYDKGQEFGPNRRHTAEVEMALRTLRKQAAKLQGRIDAEFRVLEAIQEGLEMMREGKALEWLEKSALSGERYWKSRLMVAVALGRIGEKSSVKWLRKALDDPHDAVRSAAATALGEMKAGEALPDLLKLLSDRNWQLRSAAIQALGELDEKGAVGPLIEQIEKEAGRLKEDCAQALTKLTGQKFGQVVDAWKRWWEAHKGEYGGEEGKPLGGHPPDSSGDPGKGYYGIPVLTSKAIFIIDVSGSMSKSNRDAGRDPAKGELSKIEAAKKELSRVLLGFDKKGRFDVIAFNDLVQKWQDGMVPATKSMKAKAVAWVRTLEAGSSTNIYDALHAAFEVAGMGTRDKYYSPGADTIFLLSDGSPTKPDGSPDDWMKVIRAVREWNKLKRVIIHAIGIGGHNRAFMSMLARENGGNYSAR